MKSTTKRKIGIGCLKVFEVGSSIGIPAITIYKQFPIFREPPTGRQLTAGGIMMLLVVILGLRRQLWPVLRDKLHVNSGGALIGWGLLFLAIWWLETITAMLPALRTICIAGLIGCGAGQAAHTVAGTLSSKIKSEEVADDA